MSTEIKVRIHEDAEKKELNLEVLVTQETGTELEKAIASRLRPYIEACLDGFQTMASEADQRSKDIAEAQESRIITP